MRILYIHSTQVPPSADEKTDRFFLLSEKLEGDVLHPIWTRNPEHITKTYGDSSYPVYTRAGFKYHWLLQPVAGLRGSFDTFRFCIREGLRIHREHPINCIVTYSHMTTALTGLVLKFLTGAKLIVEIVTAPGLVYLTESPEPTPKQRLMRLYSDFCLHVSLLGGNRAHLLFPDQLREFPLLRKVPASVFPEYVPMSVIGPGVPGDPPYILMVGAPWYLKGADRLIQAFFSLEADFPLVNLKIIGHYPDSAELRALTRGSARIEIIKAMHYREILQVIGSAVMLVLPSRCEGTPRVIMEAMASAVPVIGSDAGGISDLIRNGETGFIVPGGDPAELATRMRQLLSDTELRDRMARNAYEFAHGAWNEKVYVEQFAQMVADTVKQPAG